MGAASGSPKKSVQSKQSPNLVTLPEERIYKKWIRNGQLLIMQMYFSCRLLPWFHGCHDAM
jgi:hypothetical protein